MSRKIVYSTHRLIMIILLVGNDLLSSLPWNEKKPIHFVDRIDKVHIHGQKQMLIYPKTLTSVKFGFDFESLEMNHLSFGRSISIACT